MSYGLKTIGAGVPADDVRAGVAEILTEARLVVIATTGSQGPHASSVFFATDDDLALYFVSERTTRHAQELGHDDRLSGAAFIEPPVYGEGLRGVQLHGSAGEIDSGRRDIAIDLYRRRFPDFARDVEVREVLRRGEGPAALYRFVVSDLTLLDEPRLGRRVYTRATVLR